MQRVHALDLKPLASVGESAVLAVMDAGLEFCKGSGLSLSKNITQSTHCQLSEVPKPTYCWCILLSEWSVLYVIIASFLIVVAFGILSWMVICCCKR